MLLEAEQLGADETALVPAGTVARLPDLTQFVGSFICKDRVENEGMLNSKPCYVLKFIVI